jgi:hypothetical protein
MMAKASMFGLLGYPLRLDLGLELSAFLFDRIANPVRGSRLANLLKIGKM